MNPTLVSSTQTLFKPFHSHLVLTGKNVERDQ